MRQARVIFRPEGIDSLHQPRPLPSIMFLIGYDDRPVTPADCRAYEPPIRTWLERTHPDDPVTEIWFSRPEHLYWAPDKSRNGQDIVVEGGLTLSSGHRERLCLELHDSFCNCAWCRDEDIVAGESEWISQLEPPQ